MGRSTVLKEEPIEKPLRDLIDIIHFTEEVSAKIHGLLDESEIYRTVKEEFAKSKRYSTSIMLLTRDGSKLRIAETSISPKKLKVGEKVTGLRLKDYRVDLNKSETYSQVVREGKTLQSRVSDIISELLPRPLAHLITKITGYEKKKCILTPLTRHGKIIGAFGMSSTELVEYFIPSVRNLARHISSALELAAENAERKRAEEDLRKSEERYRLLVDLSPYAVVVHSEGKIVFTNSAGAELLGASSPEQLIGKPIMDFVHPDCGEIVKKRVRRVEEGKRRVPINEGKFIRLDGTELDVEVVAAPFTFQDRHAVLAIARDITDRKKAEAALRESEKRYRILFEDSPISIWSEDCSSLKECFDSLKNSGVKSFREYFENHPEEVVKCASMVKVTDVNSATLRLYDAETKEQLLNDLKSIFVEESYDMFKDGLIALAEGQTNFECETVNQTLKGERKHIAVRWSVTPGYEDSLAQMIASVVDITQQKKIEEILKESEEKLRNILASSPDAITVSDLYGNVIECNQAALDLHGFSSKEELIGKNVLELIAEKDHKRALENMKKTLEQGSVKNIEYAFLTKDGHEFSAELSASVIKDSSGNPTSLVAITEDITERKKMEEELAQERDLLHALMDNVPDAIYFKDVSSRFTRINKEHARWLRVKDPKEAIGKTDFEFYAEEFAMEAYTDEQKIFKTGKPLVEKVEKIKWRDGEFRWVSATKVPIKDKEGRVVGLVGISRDITKLKRMEEEMRRSREEYISVTNLTGDIIVRVDKEGRWTFLNDGACKFWGKPREKLLGVKFAEYLHPDDFGKTYAAIEEGIRTKQTVRGVINRQKTPKGWRTVEWNGIAFFDKSGNYAGFQATGRDITERIAMEEKLKQYTERLEELVEQKTKKLKEAQRLAAIGETAAMVGHDLRNPLQVIVNTLYLCDKRFESMPTWERKIVEKAGLLDLKRTLAEQAEYMNKIVSDLQEYARPLKPKLVPTSLHRLINDTLSAIRVPENIEVSTKVEDDLSIMLDPSLMRRCLTNLILNAMQAMPEGGRLTIRVSRTKEDAFISVQDNGLGIPKENVPKLFHPLFTTKSKGQGFGLPVCKRIVEAHNGRIAVESQDGEGSTFTVEIPLGKE